MPFYRFEVRSGVSSSILYIVSSEYDHQLDPSQIIFFKGTIEFRKLSGSSREWSYSEGTQYYGRRWMQYSYEIVKLSDDVSFITTTELLIEMNDI